MNIFRFIRPKSSVEYVFDTSTVRQALENNPDGEELVLEVNSYGGSVWSGAEIYSVLRSSKTQTRAEIQSLAASAASRTAATGLSSMHFKKGGLYGTFMDTRAKRGNAIYKDLPFGLCRCRLG